jgi:hypothetical protein
VADVVVAGCARFAVQLFQDISVGVMREPVFHWVRRAAAASLSERERASPGR